MISVIIPIYKVEAYITDCMRSVIAQKDVNLDIVLVDDCSPDNSSTIAKNLLEESGLTFQLVRHETNKGLSAARNSGIKLAKGEYLFFLDSDDEFADERALSSLYKEAKSSGADCVVGNHLYVHADYQYASEKFSERHIYSEEESIVAFCEIKIPVIACNKLIKKDFLMRNDLYFTEGILHEDQLWSFQMALAHASFLITGRLSYLYKIRSSSIMQSKTRVFDTCRIYELQVCAYLNHLPKLGTDGMVAKKYLDSFAWLCYKQLVASNGSMSIYRNIRDNQLRYAGAGARCQTRSFHLLFPPRLGFIIIKLMVNFLTRLKL